jgi:ribosomal protein S18 acetylase RimI-like enzyme
LYRKAEPDLTPTLKTRPINLDQNDVETVFRVDAYSFSKVGTVNSLLWSLEDYYKFIRGTESSKPGVVLAAFDCNLASAALAFKVRNMNMVEICHFIVLPEYRRTGTGSGLLRALLNSCYDGRVTVCVHVPETRLPLQLFFKANGFRAIHIRKDFFDGGESAYYMICNPPPIDQMATLEAF